MGSNVNVTGNKSETFENQKFRKKKIKRLEIWRMCSFLQNLACVHAAVVSEKPEITDGWTDGRRTNACVTTVALLTKLSRANKRPRGLDDLLGHLLDKRILVWCELTTVVAVQRSLKIQIQVKSRYMYNVVKNRKCTE